MRDRLPDGTDVRLGEPGAPPSVWVRGVRDANWIVVPVQPLRPPRSRDRMLVWLAIIFSTAVMAALFAAWQLQQPLRSLAQAVARFGRGQPMPPVPERGPRELRQLTHGFNQMVREVSQTENDRAVMLAGVAHDLKTPLARLRLRAEMMDEPKMRDGVVRDVDSMAHIVDQFLVFAHDRRRRQRADRSGPAVREASPAPIARWRRTPRRSARASKRARASCCPPRRSTGSSRTCSTTRTLMARRRSSSRHRAGRTAGCCGWRTTAAGIAPDDLIKASRPFVRLDPARGGNGHSGLGLAIVERLARRIGGECEIGNHEGGGLQVLMTFPFDVVTRPVAERRTGSQREERTI